MIAARSLQKFGAHCEAQYCSWQQHLSHALPSNSFPLQWVVIHVIFLSGPQQLRSKKRHMRDGGPCFQGLSCGQWEHQVERMLALTVTTDRLALQPFVQVTYYTMAGAVPLHPLA